MNVLICEDIGYEAELLADLIADSGFDVNTTIFNNAQEALAFARSGVSLDVCFLDILMPDMNGIELAEKLREEGYMGFIVFLTGSSSFAPESYRVKAFDYLIKPAEPERVKEVLTELFKAKKSADKGGIMIKGAGISRMLLFRDISHTEVIHNIVHIRLTDGTVHKTRATLAEVGPKLLEDKRFIQCHRSFIVNMNDILALKGNSFIMRDGTHVPISRSHPDAKDKYLNSIQS